MLVKPLFCSQKKNRNCKRSKKISEQRKGNNSGSVLLEDKQRQTSEEIMIRITIEEELLRKAFETLNLYSDQV